MSSAEKPSLRIAVSAEGFGFGPASKAAAVIHQISQSVNIKPTILADSVAHEFLVREGFESAGPLHPTRSDNPTIDKIVDTLDGAVVALDPSWAAYISERVPTLFLDSLGFMWAPEHFERNQSLLNVQAYAAQDVFDSIERLQKFPFKNLVSVGAIVSVDNDAAEQLGPIVHLGGLINPISPQTGLAYLEFAVELLRPLLPIAQHSQVRLLTTGLVTEAFGSDTFQVEPVAHKGAMKLLARTTQLFTSPGLTTLLEAAALQIPVVPLPPQNFSQALIITNLTSQFHNLPRIWTFLSDAYQIPYGLPEREGVLRVNELNVGYRKSQAFAAEYRSLASSCSSSAAVIPKAIAPNYDGVKQCANLLLELLGTKP